MSLFFVGARVVRALHTPSKVRAALRATVNEKSSVMAVASLLAAGDAAAASGDLNAALRSYEIAVATAPTVSGVYERYCHASASLGRVSEAQQCLRTALGLHPTSAFLHSLDGQEAVAAGLMERAAAAYARAAALRPDDGDAAMNAASTFKEAHVGRPAEAVVRLHRAVSMLDVPTSSHYTELAQAMEAAGQNSLAARAHAARSRRRGAPARSGPPRRAWRCRRGSDRARGARRGP